jgi:hypothetical protein
MKRTWVAAMAIGLIGALGTAPAHAENIGQEGCTPGYWKNHTGNWFEAGPHSLIPTNTLLNSTRVRFVTSPELAGATLHEALSFRGGSSLLDAERILLRAAAAAWLNAAHEGLGYPYRRFVAGGIVEMVNTAIASGDRAAMLAVKDRLEAANELGCPLG